jgi:hypothetical protein
MAAPRDPARSSRSLLQAAGREINNVRITGMAFAAETMNCPAWVGAPPRFHRRCGPPAEGISPWLAIVTLLLLATASTWVALSDPALIALVFGQT